jgi:hypothetical protein
MEIAITAFPEISGKEWRLTINDELLRSLTGGTYLELALSGGTDGYVFGSYEPLDEYAAESDALRVKNSALLLVVSPKLWDLVQKGASRYSKKALEDIAEAMRMLAEKSNPAALDHSGTVHFAVEAARAAGIDQRPAVKQLLNHSEVWLASFVGKSPAGWQVYAHPNAAKVNSIAFVNLCCQKRLNDALRVAHPPERRGIRIQLPQSPARASQKKTPARNSQRQVPRSVAKSAATTVSSREGEEEEEEEEEDDDNRAACVHKKKADLLREATRQGLTGLGGLKVEKICSILSDENMWGKYLDKRWPNCVGDERVDTVKELQGRLMAKGIETKPRLTKDKLCELLHAV